MRPCGAALDEAAAAAAGAAAELELELELELAAAAGLALGVAEEGIMATLLAPRWPRGMHTAGEGSSCRRRVRVSVSAAASVKKRGKLPRRKYDV